MSTFHWVLLLVDETGESVCPLCALDTLLFGSEKSRDGEIAVESSFCRGLVGYGFAAFAEEELDWKVVFGGRGGGIPRCEVGDGSERMEFSNGRTCVVDVEVGEG